jgi:hypothetical protein
MYDIDTVRPWRENRSSKLTPRCTPTPVLQAIATGIFFVQTLGLVMKDVQFFGGLQALNLDVEVAAGKCVSPLTTTERFYVKVRDDCVAASGWPRLTQCWQVIVLPVVLILGTLLVSVPIWTILRRKLPTRVWDFFQTPEALTWSHIKRCFLNTCACTGQM